MSNPGRGRGNQGSQNTPPNTPLARVRDPSRQFIARQTPQLNRTASDLGVRFNVPSNTPPPPSPVPSLRNDALMVLPSDATAPPVRPPPVKINYYDAWNKIDITKFWGWEKRDLLDADPGFEVLIKGKLDPVAREKFSNQMYIPMTPDKQVFFVDHVRGVTQWQSPVPNHPYVTELPRLEDLPGHVRTTAPFYRAIVEETRVDENGALVNELKTRTTKLRIEFGQTVDFLASDDCEKFLLPREWEIVRILPKPSIRRQSHIENYGFLVFINHHNGCVLHQKDPRLFWMKNDECAMLYRPLVTQTLINVNGQPFQRQEIMDGYPLKDRLQYFHAFCCMNTKSTYTLEDYIAGRFHNMSPPAKSVIIRDDHLFVDSYLWFCANLKGHQLRRYITFKLMSKSSEDYTGVFKEWVSRLSKDFSKIGTSTINGVPDSEHLRLFEDHPQLGWIIALSSAGRTELLPLFRFFGRFMAMAFFHCQVVDMEISPLLLKAIQGRPITGMDLVSKNVDIHTGFMRLRTMTRAKFDALATEWLVLTSSVNQKKETYYSMADNDGHRPVGGVSYEDRESLLVKRIQFEVCRGTQQVDAIRQGISDVIPLEMIRFFRLDELHKIIFGSTELDVEDWKANTESTNWVPPQVLEHFWAFVEQASEEERRQLLTFVTSSSRTPSEGFRALTPHFNITYNARLPVDGFPMASTCFNRITLPDYTSAEECAAKIRYAIRYALTLERQ